MKNLFTSLSLVGLLLIGCTGNDAEQAKQAATLANLKRHTESLSSDACQGRKPFSTGAARAVNYLTEEMKAIGLQPINGDSYLQEVPLVLSETTCSPEMAIHTPKGEMSLTYMSDFVGFSKRIEPKIDIKEAELVFAGYGIVAPEYGKNDFAGIEHPENKVAIVIVNDPGLGQTVDYFKGDTMTYYGRWMYKYEEGARQGVKGVLIIHEDRGAGYPWNVVAAGAKSKLYIDNKDNKHTSCPLEGWITNDAAMELMKRNGYNLAELKEQAKRADFTPIPLQSTVSVSMQNEFTYNSSPNVAGYIEGSKKNEESIVYTAHWDHLGYGAPIEGDSIINGATDNATAMAWLLETARCFQALKQKPERNIVFLIPTCEETGFQGTIYYTEHPLFPIEKTVAVINCDVLPLWGANNDVTITGYGHSSLDVTLAELAKKYNRYIMPDPDAFNGMFYRSDHFPFMRRGIPALFAKGWNDNREHGSEWAAEKIKDYWKHIYHKPTDQVCPATDNYDGVMQEVQLFFDLGYQLANSSDFPTWSPRSEFGSILKR